MRPTHAITTSALAAILLCCGCDATATDDATRKELSALRAEVRALHAEVRALAQRYPPVPVAVPGSTSASSAADAGTPGRPASPSTPSNAAPGAAAPEAITLTFVVDPVDASITIDGLALDGRTLQRPASGQRVRVRLDRPGFRSIEQQVSLRQSRQLRYQLMPGRGVTRLGSL